MSFWEALHNFALPIPIVGHYLVFLSAVLFVWSLALIRHPEPSRGFMIVLRLNWLAYALNTVAGLALQFTGERVPSAVADAARGDGRTVLGYLPDPSRHWEHLMYGLIAILSLGGAEVILNGRKYGMTRWARFVPVATLLLAAVAYRAVQVAYLPGATPGT